MILCNEPISVIGTILVGIPEGIFPVGSIVPAIEAISDDNNKPAFVVASGGSFLEARDDDDESRISATVVTYEIGSIRVKEVAISPVGVAVRKISGARVADAAAISPVGSAVGIPAAIAKLRVCDGIMEEAGVEAGSVVGIVLFPVARGIVFVEANLVVSSWYVVGNLLLVVVVVVVVSASVRGSVRGSASEREAKLTSPVGSAVGMMPVVFNDGAVVSGIPAIATISEDEVRGGAENAAISPMGSVGIIPVLVRDITSASDDETILFPGGIIISVDASISEDPADREVVAILCS